MMYIIISASSESLIHVIVSCFSSLKLQTQQNCRLGATDESLLACSICITMAIHKENHDTPVYHHYLFPFELFPQLKAEKEPGSSSGGGRVELVAVNGDEFDMISAI